MIANNVTIGHHCNIGLGTYIAAEATIGAYSQIGKNVFVGLGATCVPGKIIGNGSYISASALITKDAPEFSHMVGSPARNIRI